MKTTNRLTDGTIKSLLKDGKPTRYPDGAGLYFVKTTYGTGNWVLMYRLNGKSREMGLGAYTGTAVLTLAEARKKAQAARVEIGAGRDPLAAKKLAAPAATFRAMMEAKIASKLVGWGRTADKNAKDWRSTLTNHAAALLDVSVAKVDTAKVLAVLAPIWTTKIETADRVRERIAQVLDFADDKLKLGMGKNPADKGTITNLLGAQKASSTKGESHVAMDRAMIQPFFEQLRAVEGNEARCLEFLMMVGARSGEARGMLRSELDLDEGLWHVPAERMKAGKKHTFTLSSQAIELLRAMPVMEGSDVVFWNGNGNKFDAVVLRRLLRKMGVTPEQATVHGFRACFCSWAFDTGGQSAKLLARFAIAHVDGSKADIVYERGEALDLRFDLLQGWCDFISNPTVVPFRKKVA